ncbi:MAG: hypothetical protein AB1721_02770 [Patescibacteria group bacterium]
MVQAELKKQVVKLRRQGKTYTEICQILKKEIPKSTLSYWCQGIALPKEYYRKIKQIASQNRLAALEANKKRRQEYLNSLFRNNLFSKALLRNNQVAKLALIVLYFSQGSLSRRSSLMLSSSNPKIISLFLKLLNQSYQIDKTKFRVTIFCRADQSAKKLELFWGRLTKIPKTQFYKTQKDPRTKNISSRKNNYKGTCKTEYFSAEVYNDIMAGIQVIDQEFLGNGPMV